MRFGFLSFLGLLAGAMSWAVPLSEGPLDASASSDSLDLDQAIALALKHHPGLEAQRSSVAARDAAAAQAALGSNPELAVELEDLAGTGAYRGVDALQTTVQLSQTLEWSGKRSRRAAVAQSERNLAEIELARKRREIRAVAAGHFLEALTAQRRLSLALESKSLSDRLLEAVTRRVKEGAASAADELRAHLAVTQAAMEIRQNTVRLESAKGKLALLWGGKGGAPPLRDAAQAWKAAPPLPPLEELLNTMETGAPSAALAGNVSLAEARLAQQRSLSGPDVTLSAGIRHNAEPGDIALVGGIAMPLPLRNRNQGGAAEAKHELERARAERKAAVLDLQSKASDIHRDLRLTRDEIDTLRDSVIPDAAKAAGVLEEGYKRGRFGMLEVLNAESDLFRHRLRHLECLLRYQTDYLELERLMGMGD